MPSTKPAEDFQIGDCVYLKSGGLAMTAEEFDFRMFDGEAILQSISCVWMTECGSLCRDTFNVLCLTKDKS